MRFLLPIPQPLHYSPGTLMTVAKTYPSKSAGPHFPSLPLKSPLLRLIPGNPRFAISPIQPLSASRLPDNLLLRANVLSSTASIRLPNTTDSIPDYYFDFKFDDIAACFLVISLHLHDDSDTLLARVVLLQNEIENMNGVLVRPLLGLDGVPMASLTLAYQVISPCFGAPEEVMEADVPRLTGHRGMGGNGLHAPWRVLENMPESFLMASMRDDRVKTVELDVQLSKDGKTVIYHDWCFRPKGAAVKVPLYSLEFNELDRLFTESNQGVKVGDKVGKLVERRNDIADECLDFAMNGLADICQWLPEEVGMLVEVKYPAPNVQEKLMIPYPEKNHIVNIVLEDLFKVERNKGRKISFLSFDADVCMLLALKQKNYPVYLSHCMALDKPCEEFDPRCIDIDEGLKFAKAQGLKGMMLFNEIVERKPDAIKKIVMEGLPIITYGRRNTEAHFVQKQFEVGVTGVIADDVDILADQLGV